LARNYAKHSLVALEVLALT